MSRQKPTGPDSTPSEQIAKIFALGARPVLLKERSKVPAETSWPDLEPTQQEVEDHVAAGGNVGVILGPKSGNLTDVDLDSLESVSLARFFLPRTGLVHGRASSPASHYWYRCVGDIRRRSYADPAPNKGERATLVELRGDGHQTAVPPTIHPSGEAVKWEKDGEPAVVEEPTLVAALGRLAAGALLVRVWTEGRRNDLALAVSGWLLRAGWELSRVEDFLSFVSRVAGDQEVEQRIGVVAPTAEKLISSQPVAGWRSLADLIGEPRAKALRKWLPTKKEEAEDGRPALPPPIGVKELFELPERVTRFLVEGLIETATNLLVVGYPKSYKTFVILELAVALATGTPFFHHFRVNDRRRVGLILMEDRHDRVRHRFWRIARSRGWEAKDLEGYVAFWFRPPLVLTDAAAMRKLAEYVMDEELDVLLIDNWSYVSEGDSNDADNVTRHLRLLADLRHVRPELVVGLVQHARKKGPGQGKRLTDVTRNSSAFGAWHDVSLLLELDGEVIEVRVEVRDLPEPDPFTVEVRDEKPGHPEEPVDPSGALTIRVIEDKASPEHPLEEAILDFLRDHPGSTKNAIYAGVTGQKTRIKEALERLKTTGRVRIDKTGRAHKCYALDEDGEIDDTPSF